jgi:hypothetical protein
MPKNLGFKTSKPARGRKKSLLREKTEDSARKSSVAGNTKLRKVHISRKFNKFLFELLN